MPNLLETIRNKPQAERIRLIWLTCGGVAVILIIAWLIIGGVKKDGQKDLRLFQQLGKSVKEANDSLRHLPKQPNP